MHEEGETTVAVFMRRGKGTPGCSWMWEWEKEDERRGSVAQSHLYARVTDATQSAGFFFVIYIFGIGEVHVAE